MLQTVVDSLKDAFQPATTGTVLLLVMMGTALLYLGKGRWGRRWLTAVVLVYWMLATPACGGLLEQPLTRGVGHLQDAASAGGAGAIVLLSGGGLLYTASGGSIMALSEQSAFRMLEVARVYKLLGKATVIVSGNGGTENAEAGAESVLMRQALVRLGVQPIDIIFAGASTSTDEQARRVKEVLTNLRISVCVMVTSPARVRRALAVFAAHGVRAVPSVAAEQIDSERRNQFTPTTHTIAISLTALYEYTALVYYQLTGRLSPHA
jgi:uncharacterized SAM-binding protein YcdF (DUF218 family)